MYTNSGRRMSNDELDRILKYFRKYGIGRFMGIYPRYSKHQNPKGYKRKVRKKEFNYKEK